MGLTDSAERPGFILSTVDALLRWGRSHSMWICNAGSACCSLEMLAAGGPRYDMDRFGTMVRASPRQSDILVIPGPITKKMAPVFTRVYNQMAEPRWVIAMGSCAITGGAFRESYSMTKGADTVLPVDVFVPGCPVRPEALIYALLLLRKKIQTTTTVGESHREPVYLPPVLPPEWTAEVDAFLGEGEVCAE
ncbi:MAG TPA: NADH-quinone oxidoreductase subunit B family protein [Coriobacteriia bacterium]